MFVAIDRTSKFAFVELHEKAKTATARDFLHRLIDAVPYKIHTVLPDNGIHVGRFFFKNGIDSAALAHLEDPDPERLGDRPFASPWGVLARVKASTE